MKKMPNDFRINGESVLDLVLNDLALGVIDGEEAKDRIAKLVRKKKKRKESENNGYSHSDADGYDCNLVADSAFAD